MDENTPFFPPVSAALYSHYLLDPLLNDCHHTQMLEEIAGEKDSAFYPCVVYETSSTLSCTFKTYTVRRLGQMATEQLPEGLLVDVKEVFSGAERIIHKFPFSDHPNGHDQAPTMAVQDILHLLTRDVGVWTFFYRNKLF
jgi:hypothetical protein